MNAPIVAPESTAAMLGSKHCRAICEEIGERLALVLRPETAELPPRLKDLLDRLALLDHDAPSIAPSIRDMANTAEPRESSRFARKSLA